MHVLMVTIGYPPLQVGGTEVYVHGLVEALKAKSVRSTVVYTEPFADEGGPEFRVETRRCDGTTVYAIGVNTTRHKLEFITFDAHLRGLLLSEFQTLVEKLNPDLIHVHPLQLGFDSYLIEALNRAGRKVILTYHSTTTTCARGDLIYMGQSVCDGLVEQKRCTKCLYHWKSVPSSIAAGIAQIPPGWLRASHARLSGKLRSFISVPLIIEERRKQWARATENASRIVAVCNWVRETIIKNGVSADKVVFSRHGLRLGSDSLLECGDSLTALASASANGGSAPHKTRFGYLGRISPEKGIDLLLSVLSEIPREIDYEVEFCSSSFKAATRPEEVTLVRSIIELSKRDQRVRVLDKVSDSDLRSVLADWDAMVVPSRWLESGPQVIYEAFAVRTPIIGSRLGGIAELVSEGKTGLLFEPNNASELSRLLVESAKDPSQLRALRKNIPPVRTTSDVADDMLKVYESVTRLGARTVSAIPHL